MGSIGDQVGRPFWAWLRWCLLWMFEFDVPWLGDSTRHQNPIFFKRLLDWNFEVVRGLFIFGKALQEQSMPDPLLVEKMEDDSKIWIPSSRGPTIRRKTTWKKITMELQFQSPCEEFNFCRQNAFHRFNTWRIISRMKGSHKLLELFAVNKGKRQMSLSHPTKEFFVYFLSMISRDQIFIEFSNFWWSLNNCPRDENTMFFLQVAFWEIQFPCWWNALLVVFVKEEFLSHQLANMASRRLRWIHRVSPKIVPHSWSSFFQSFEFRSYNDLMRVHCKCNLKSLFLKTEK